ncbi:hypothetical protein OWV82_008179 [Melia azedarach]|uniref:Uncharacterized protein n=1 Tax=Melia azedarach TaxID=155640 RepID=A0ACC1YA70_MELAZ|nr:hypothetical protein OWV82_008179 [Melia azedarach]
MSSCLLLTFSDTRPIRSPELPKPDERMLQQRPAIGERRRELHVLHARSLQMTASSCISCKCRLRHTGGR